jgi:hypothetical protein
MRPIRGGRVARLTLACTGALSLAIPGAALARTAGPFAALADSTHPVGTSAPHPTFTWPTGRTASQRGCHQLFTVKMGEGAANLIYSGQGHVSEHALRVLGYIERCQRNPAAESFVRRYDHDQSQLQHARVMAALAAAPAPAPASRASGGGDGWAIPNSVVQCESGGQNQPPNYVGASGYYQIIPSTWLAYGGGQYAPSAYQATAAQQASVASRIWDGGAGASQWVCAGG